MLGIHAGCCEGSSVLVRTTRTLLRALGGARTGVCVEWTAEIHHVLKQGREWQPECAHTAGRAAERLQCLHRLARATLNATFVYKTGLAARDYTAP